MKLFLDTANVEHIREIHSWGVLSGVTTNPTLAAREKRPYAECVKEICSITDGPVSAEAVSLETDGIISEARELAKIAPNVNIKVPICPNGLAAIKALREISQASSRAMQEAMAAHHEERAVHELRKIAVALSKVREFAAQARQCIGEVWVSKGEHWRRWTDEKPDEPPPFDPVELPDFEEGPCGSCFL